MLMSTTSKPRCFAEVLKSVASSWMLTTVRFRFRSSAENAYFMVSNILGVKKKLTLAEWIKLFNIYQKPGLAFQASRVLLKQSSGMEDFRTLLRAQEQTGGMNPVLKVKLMGVFQSYKDDCTESDHTFIYNAVNEALNSLPSINTEVAVDLLHGLDAVPKWKEYMDLVFDKLGDKENFDVLQAAAVTAFAHYDLKTGYKFLSKVMPIRSSTNVFNPMLLQRMLDAHLKDNSVFQFLDTLEKQSYMLPIDPAEQLRAHFEATKNWVSRFTSILPSGQCSCCKRSLRRVPIEAEEFDSLLRNVDKTFDVDCEFNTYEREEVDEFKKFLRHHPLSTIVMDGLNVYHRFRTPIKMRPLIKALEEQGCRLLVITRKHMKTDPIFQSLFKKHSCYYVQNRSHDDSFIIYASLYYGPKTFLVSNDCYGKWYDKISPDQQHIFRKWQLSNQVVLVGQGDNQTFVFPKFTPVAQKTDDGLSYHLPITSNERSNAFSPSGWMCLQKVTKAQKRKSQELWPITELEIDPSLESSGYKMYLAQVKSRPVTKPQQKQFTTKFKSEVKKPYGQRKKLGTSQHNCQ